MRKAFIIVTGILFILLSAACRPFTADIGSYLGYWSSEAFVVSADINTETQNDASGMVSVASAKDVIITLKVQNPKSFKLVMPSASETRNIVDFAHLTGTKPVVDSDYTLEQPDDDRKVLTLTYKAGFLQNSEWGEKDVSSTITLYADDGREFKHPYTFKIKANTPPATPGFTVAKTKDLPAYYVLCITVPDMDKKVQGSRLLHKDITRIEVNGTPYPFSVNEAENRFEKPESGLFMSYSAVEKLDDSDAADVPSGGWVLYYKTDVEVREGAAKKGYTVRLADAKGLVSGILNASTKPNKAEAEKVDITKGNIFGPGSGNSEGDPVIIACDSTGAELKVSSATAGVTVHGTLTDTGTAESTQYNGNPITVPLPLNGAGEKTYKLEYYTDGEGFARTDVKTVYYKILKGYTVTFDANGGSYPDGTTAVSKAALHGMAVSAPDPLPAQQGFGVTGWYKDKACSAGQAWNFATDTVIGDMTLYAQWTAGADTPYKVEHYQQNIDETYPATAIYSEEKTGTTGALLSVGNGITPRTDAGFEYDKLEPASPAIGADGKTVVKVYYKRKTYTVNFSVDGSGGTISAVVTGGSITSPSSASVKYGGSIAFTATPTDATRHKVGGWSCTPSAEGFTVESGLATASLTVTAKATVSVQFVPLNALTVKKFEIHGKDASNGSVSLDYKDAQIAQDDIKLEFNEHSGLTFTTDPLLPLTLEEGNTKKLTIIVAGSPGQYPEWKKEITITRNKNHVANLTSFTLNGETKNAPFKSEYIVASKTAEVKDFTFDTASTGATASVSPQGSVSIPVGTGRNFTITVKAQDGTQNTVTFTVKRKKYDVTFFVYGGTGGTLKAKPEGGTASTTTATGTVSVEHGTQVDFTAKPDEGYEVDSWTGATADTPNTTATLLNVTTNDITVIVKFKKKVYEVTFSVAAGKGKLEGEGGGYINTATGYTPVTLTIPHGGKVDFTATPATSAGAWKVAGWKKNDAAVNETNSTYTLSNVTSNTTVTVKFYQSEMDGTASMAWRALLNAVSNAPDGATLKISGTIQATNYGSGNNANYGKISIDKDLTIKGEGGAGILDANQLSPIFIVQHNKTFTLDHMTLKNGKKEGAPQYTGSTGCGVYTYGTFNMQDSTITNCEAVGDGGGVYVASGGTCIMKNSTITGCTATENGGGVCVSGGIFKMQGSSTITGCTASKGGGVYVSSGTFKMQDSAIVTPSTGSEQYTAGKNDVYLESGKTITIDGTLTGTAPVARITVPNTAYNTSAQVLAGTITGGSPQNYTKFTVTPQDVVDGKMFWYITAAGKLKAEVEDLQTLKEAVQAAPADNTPFVIKLAGTISIREMVQIPNGKKITLKADNASKPAILKCSHNWQIYTYFDVQSGAALTLEGLITLQGVDSSYRKLHYALSVNQNGNAEIKNGVTITGFKNYNVTSNGVEQAGKGPVFVDGTLTMSGGTIKENTVVNDATVWSGGGGGGVYVGATGNFIMKGGTITQNEASGYNTSNGGSGVYVKGQFTMEGGTIEKNKTAYAGGGVLVGGGVFNMEGGKITENQSNRGKGVMVRGGIFNWNNGQITTNYGYGNAVVTESGGAFNDNGHTAS
ncbi:InlB B-repeat-containing protein [Treponema vincentii]|uniref:InlB B-repeat-containing protein n=1 Tax=Treponema vincentii TaxID=69710 RepID=UPI0035F5B79E